MLRFRDTADCRVEIQFIKTHSLFHLEFTHDPLEQINSSLPAGSGDPRL